MIEGINLPKRREISPGVSPFFAASLQQRYSYAPTAAFCKHSNINNQTPYFVYSHKVYIVLTAQHELLWLWFSTGEQYLQQHTPHK